MKSQELKWKVKNIETKMKTAGDPSGLPHLGVKPGFLI